MRVLIIATPGQATALARAIRTRLPAEDCKIRTVAATFDLCVVLVTSVPHATGSGLEARMHVVIAAPRVTESGQLVVESLDIGAADACERIRRCR